MDCTVPYTWWRLLEHLLVAVGIGTVFTGFCFCVVALLAKVMDAMAVDL